MTNETQWGPWFQGTGERPDGVRDGDEVQYRSVSDMIVETSRGSQYLAWYPNHECRLRADHPYYTKDGNPPLVIDQMIATLEATDDSPPLWALDEATRRGTSFKNWAVLHSQNAHPWLQKAITAHARTIAKYVTPPDPDAVYREYCARLMDAFSDSDEDADAMIAELKTIIAEHGGKS